MQHVYLNSDDLTSTLWDEASSTAIVENFSFLVNNLEAFDPKEFSYAGKGLPDVRGGKRRILRVATIMANKFASQYNINYVGENTENKVVGVSVPVDTWNLTHVDYNDTELKERHATPSNPYVVSITSRRTLNDGSATRCTVSCNCEDFNTTFRWELKELGYLEDDKIASPTVKSTTPAVCKHIFAILFKEPTYLRQMMHVEHMVASPNAAITAVPNKLSTPVEPPEETRPIQPITVTPGVQPQQPIGNEYEMALATIQAALTAESARINPNDIANYQNNTFGSKRDIKGKYFKYRFTVKRPRNGLVGAVKIFVTATGAELPVPDKSIWDLFNLHKNPKAHRIHAKRIEDLRELVRDTGEMPENLQSTIQPGVYLEQSDYVDETLLAEDVSISSILSSVTK